MTSAAVAHRRYTYADLVDLPADDRYEIIDGELFVNPSPTTRHQVIVGRIFRILSAQLEDKGYGHVFIAPLDTVFSSDNVVQPDVIYVSKARATVVTSANLQGAPDLAAEVLSPSTHGRDLKTKKALYARFGVRFYLVVDHEAERVELFRLDGKKYKKPVTVESPETLKIAELHGLRIDLAALFA